MADTVTFLNTRFNRMTPQEAVAILLERVLERQSDKIFFANAHTLVTASKQPELAACLRQSDFLLADGSGVRWGSALLGTPLLHNLNGTDLVPALCRAGAERGLSVYLLGSKPGVAEEAATNLTRRYPGLVIAGTRHGYFSPEENPAILEEIRAARPHLLLVALGVPLQETWITCHAPQLPGITCMGVGGLFDFIARRVPRAPKPVRAVGMEWGWRLAMEPRRLWKRYLVGNLVFIGKLAGHAFSYREDTQEDGEWRLDYPYEVTGETRAGDYEYQEVGTA